ncbi:MAG: SAM-dependent methyltransferase, partial [Pirellulaceae bacterium]
CNSATLTPHPSSDDLSSFYPPIYCFAPDQGKAGFLKRLRQKLEFNLFFLPQYRDQVKRVLRGTNWNGEKDRRLLDIGCGQGFRLQPFQERGFKVEGMDFQPESVDYVRNHLGIDAACCDIEGLTTHFDSDFYDVITAFYVVEHVPSVVDFFTQCFTLLKPGGWVAASVPLVDSIQCRLLASRWASVTEAPRHLSIPTQDGLRAVCNEMGFTHVNIVPDSLSVCSAQIGMSLFPGGLNTHTHGSRSLSATFARSLGAVTTILSIPMIAIENYILGRPGLGIVFAQKPY